MNLLVWWEHVDSEANIADDGSRAGRDAPIYAKHLVSVTDIQFPEWPQHLRQASIGEWLQWLNSLVDGICTHPLLNDRWCRCERHDKFQTIELKLSS
eukprot:9661580-Karenia_brevis.AAC.1